MKQGTSQELYKQAHDNHYKSKISGGHTRYMPWLYLNIQIQKKPFTQLNK